MIQAIALDDEMPALKVLGNFCNKVDFINLQQTFNKPTAATQYLAENTVDLLFLDINMPSITGIDFHRTLKKPMMVIFTTAYSEYAIEGFNLNAIDYLLKPFTFERFVQGVAKAQDLWISQQKQGQMGGKIPTYLYVKADYSVYKIDTDDILFVEGLDDYLKIHLQNAKPIVARMTMKAMLEKLPFLEFSRVHRSYIIALSRIENIRNKVIYLAGEEIPIGTSYEKEFFARFQ
jgi:DNA-binding LytR/AlgR family response regulator